MKIKRIELPFDVKAVDSEAASVEGYVSVFGVVDAYGDVIEPGAFKASLAKHSESGTAPAMLWQHNPDWPIGVWTSMEEDDHGLKMSGNLADTALGRDTSSLLRMKAITGASIGYVPKVWEIDKESGLRNLKEIDLWEASLVTFPANEEARVEARAAEIAEMEISDIERVLRDAGMPRREAKTVISRLMHLGAERDAGAIRAAAETKAALDRLRQAIGG